MAIQFMFSPDGLDGMSASQIREAMACRTNGVWAGSSEVSTISGKKYLTSLSAGSLDGTLYTFPAGTTECWIGVRFSPWGTNMSGTSMAITDALGTIALALKPDGFVKLTSDVTGTVNDINLSTPGTGNGTYVEVYLSATTAELYINGATTPSATATVAARGPFSAINLYSLPTNAGRAFCDFYVGTTRMGDTEIRLAPSVSAATTGTLVGGTAAQAVALDTAAVYSSLEPGQTLTSNVGGSITDNPQTIHALQVTSLGRKSGTALLPEKVLVATPAGTEEIEPAIPLGLGFGSQSLVMATDPNDNAAWTKAKVNGLTVGG